jgi:predicted transcriptional regulator
MNRSNRSKHEIISDILTVIKVDAGTFSEIQFKIHISHPRLKKYLTHLVQSELIVYVKQEKRFRITQRGLYVLDTYAKLEKLLSRKL